MKLKEEILAEHSKVQADKIADWIGSSPAKFDKLIQLFLHDEYRVIQRAAWIVSIIAHRHPKLIMPHLEHLVGKIAQPDQHPAVRRNVVRILEMVDDIPEPLHGPVLNACFDFLADPKEAIAVRAFSLTVLGNLAKHYPDIIPELKAITDDIMSHDPTPALIVRVRRVLKELKISR